jgi:uncharacterized protein YbaA (DUF1428 family)
MSYIQGFLLAVPERNKAAYIGMTERVWPVFRDHGCLASQECWGDDVPEGKVTSFPMAVKLEPGEVVVFSWMEWPDRETCDRSWEAIMADPRMQVMTDVPFDGMRMMWGGFVPIFSARA